MKFPTDPELIDALAVIQDVFITMVTRVLTNVDIWDTWPERVPLPHSTGRVVTEVVSGVLQECGDKSRVAKAPVVEG